MSEIAGRIARLRRLMEERGIDAYLIPTSDYHDSEYVGEHFACREYITGFTGSAGTALVTRDWAGLWTDGRYFVQAAEELSGSGVELMKMGRPGVPSVEDYLKEHLPERGVLGFDGRVVNAKTGEELEKWLSLHEIGFGKHYPIPIYRQPSYAAAYEGETYPIADRISESELSLPMYYGMTDDQIDKVIGTLNNF